MGPVAGWAIPAAVGLVGSYLQHRDSKSAANNTNALASQQLQMAQQAIPQANQFLSQANQALGPSMSYYTSMLANPREATAPEQNRISGLYSGQASTVRNMYPRGGYGPTGAENLRNQQRQATENVIQTGRPMAAQGLANIGTNLAGLGFQGYGLGSGILSNVFQQGLQNRQQQFSQGAALGSGLFNAYNAYLLSRATQPTSGSLPSGGSLYYGNTGNQVNPSDLTPGSSTSTPSFGLYGGG